MKKLIFTFLLCAGCFFAKAQHTYISSSGNVVLYSGATVRYGSPDIYVSSCYDNWRGVWIATLQLGASGATANFEATYQYEFDNATVDALTPTGATTTEKTKNVILQAVQATLVALNGAIFTLH